MIIRSEFLSEGLFGEALTWILEILPYLESKGLKPEWDIRHPNYGAPPTYNIFPDILRPRYIPAPPQEIVSFETLKNKEGFSFRGDFQLASRYWNTWFQFSGELYRYLDDFFQKEVQGGPIVGVHYRGTDKNNDSGQTNPISSSQFLLTLEDFLTNHRIAETIFVASDDSEFIADLLSFARGRWVVLQHAQRRSTGHWPLFRGHNPAQNIDIAKFAVLDCLTLSRCQSVLTTMSALSAFAKVLNPEVEIYRAAACKPDWFPVAYTKRYRGHSRPIKTMLSKLQAGDRNSTLIEKTIAFPNKLRRRLARSLKTK